MLEHDIMSIELVALDSVIPNVIIKQTDITFIAQTNSWHQLKSQKLYLCQCIVLLNIAIWDVRTQSHVHRVGGPCSSYSQCNYESNSHDLQSPN